MKINIFIFEVLKSQDFLDPDFSDTCIGSRTHMKMSGIMDPSTLKDPGPTYICRKNLDPKNPGSSTNKSIP